MTQFPGWSLRKVEGAEHFSALPPTLGIPRLWASGGLWRLGASERVGAGGEQLPRGGPVWGAQPAQAGPARQLRWAQSTHPAPPRDLLRPLGVWAWELLVHLGGGGQGRAGEPAPPPGKQALPHILRAPLPFPAPSQPGEGPSTTPLPAPRGRRSLHLCRKWGCSRGHAESDTESPAAALS